MTAQIERGQEINGGAEFNNTRVRLSLLLDSQQKNARTYIEKEEMYAPNHRADMYIEHYTLLKRLGFPVPATVRKISGTNKLIVSDLTSNGKYDVFSDNELKTGKRKGAMQITDMQKVQDQLLQIAQKADAANITLTYDTYFFLVDRDGNTKVILGDLGMGVIPNQFGPTKSLEHAAKLFKMITNVREGRGSLHGIY